jgi:hypothetical protein
MNQNNNHSSISSNTRIDGFTWKWMTRIVPKQLFDNVTLFNDSGISTGFSIDLITVHFHRNDNTMEIWKFDESNGRCDSANYIFPQSVPELMKRLKFHCGDIPQLQPKNNHQ